MTGYPMLLNNTLLGRCIERNAGMWITDCTLYMQVWGMVWSSVAGGVEMWSGEHLQPAL